jgi:hypothetical protein
MKILFKSLIIIILMISCYILPLYHPAGIAVYFRLFLLFLILVESLKLFKIIIIDKKVNKIISNLGTVLLSVFVTFIFLEVIFMFIPQSHGAGLTLGAKLWFSKYWNPINSLGFRDKEPGNNNPVILFVGDSFTAGMGLKSVDDRFSNIVGRELNKKGQKYTVINIGKIDIGSRDEYDEMKNFFYMTRIKPEKIILQYYGNDIEDTAINNGLTFSIPLAMHRFLIAISSGSYLFNYIYWLFPSEYNAEQYMAFLHQAYKNDKILSKHKDECKLFVDYANENSIQLIVVVFPFLNNVERSNLMYVDNIVNFFKNNNVITINVSQLVKDIPVAERTVNASDIHASKKVNEIVAHDTLNKLK